MLSFAILCASKKNQDHFADLYSAGKLIYFHCVMHFFKDPLFSAMQKRKRKKRKTEKKNETESKSFYLIEKPGSLLRRKVRLNKTTKISDKRIGQLQPNSSMTPATPIKCSVCNMVFHSGSKWNLERHMQLHSTSVKRYRCLSCSRSYSTEYNFKKHLPRRHPNEDHSTINFKINYERGQNRPTFSQLF